MGPFAQSDGHDPPRLADEMVPGLAGGVEDLLVGFEDAVGEIGLAPAPASASALALAPKLYARLTLVRVLKLKLAAIKDNNIRTQRTDTSATPLRSATYRQAADLAFGPVNMMPKSNPRQSHCDSFGWWAGAELTQPQHDRAMQNHTDQLGLAVGLGLFENALQMAAGGIQAHIILVCRPGESLALQKVKGQSGFRCGKIVESHQGLGRSVVVAFRIGDENCSDRIRWRCVIATA